jgi:hypothetical protein
MTPEKQIFDADQARLVLENEQFKAAFEEFEQEIFTAWTNSPKRDEEGRQELFRLLSSAKKFRSILETRLQTGQMAKMQLEQERAMLTQDRSIDTRGWASIYSS